MSIALIMTAEATAAAATQAVPTIPATTILSVLRRGSRETALAGRIDARIAPTARSDAMNPPA